MFVFQPLTSRDRRRRHPAIFACLVVSAGCLLSPGTGRAGDALGATTAYIENIGQLDESVRFSTSASGMNVFLTEDGLVIDLFDPVAREASEPPPSDLSGRSPVLETMGRDGHVVRIRFEGANPAPTVTGDTVLPGVFNFFHGADPASWHTGARRFSEVVYHEIWPGIDLVFRVTPTGVEYEARVGPGADASQVRFAYEGADLVQESTGADRIETSVGDLVHRLPVAGETSASIRRGGTGEGSPLGGDCDVFFDWVTLLGGVGEDWGSAVVLDASGRPVVIGQTTSTDFPTTMGAYADSSAGDWDSFVTKLTAEGDDLVWSTYIGGELRDWGLALALDGSDNAVITGLTRSADYPTTPGAYDTTPSPPVDDNDVFVTKLSAEGNSLIWSTYLGGDLDRNEAARGIALDAQGNVLVCGSTQSGDFPTTAGAFRTTHPDEDLDAFVTKLTADGDDLVWSTLLGSHNGGEFILEIALDAAENPVVCGLTGSIGFPTTPDAFDRTYNGNNDGFITKLAADGTSLEWSTFVGGTSADRVECVEIDPLSGDVLAGVRTRSSDFPTTPGAFDTTYDSPIDGAVLRMSEDGEELLWSTFLGGAGEDWLGGIATGPDYPGYLVVAGSTEAEDFPTTGDAFASTYSGGILDGFITIVRYDGAELLWSTYVGGSSDGTWGEGFTDDNGKPVVVSGNEAYIVGMAGSDDFPTCPSGGVWDETFNGVLDVAVLRMPLSPLTTDVDPDFPAIPAMLQIQSLAPNPFHPSTEIAFEIPQSGPVTLGVYDVSGRRVVEIPLGILQAGQHRARWDGRHEDGYPVPAGVYFLRLQGSTSQSRPVRAVLIR